MTTATIREAEGLLSRTVASNVRAEMGRYNVTQQRIAAALGLKQQNVSDRLRGRTPFTLDEIGIIAPLFDMTAVELIAGVRAGETPPPVAPPRPQRETSAVSHRRPRRDSNAGQMAYKRAGSLGVVVPLPTRELVAA